MVTLWKIKPQPVYLAKIIGRAYSCTCHIPDSSRFGYHDVDPRPIILLDGLSEWQHVDDGTAASTHHIHVSRNASDCDGPIDHYHVDLPRPGDEGGSMFSHWMRALQWLPNAAVYVEGTMTVKHHEDGTYSAEWSAPTDEGYEHEEIRVCLDPHCAYDRASQRDHFAEAMGY